MNMKANNECNKLRLAIQKSGRLHDDSMKLLKECGIDISNGVNKLKAEATNFPIEVFFLRDDDIPQYVEDGVADIGFVGENVIFEKNKQVAIAEKLGFGKCRLSIAIPKGQEDPSSQYLQGKKIATSYPVIVNNQLQSQGVKAEIHEISGSVEIAPGIGLADAICDLVSSGSTLLTNGLKEVDIVLQSQAILITTEHLSEQATSILNKLILRINAVNVARCN